MGEERKGICDSNTKRKTADNRKERKKRSYKRLGWKEGRGQKETRWKQVRSKEERPEVKRGQA